MQIKDMFRKKIDREIQGVIIVGQGEETNVAQELEEYVVTRELQRHFADFFAAYKKGIQGTTPKMGVWISGFFGSGKSHFLKILSYLLQNKQVGDKHAIDYFIEDQMLPGNGKFERTGLGSDRDCKESTNTAFNFLKANGNRISGSISTTMRDYIINYQDLQGIGMTGKLALPTLIALCSIALGRPTVSTLAVLGEISISGTILKVDELANSLQVCLDSGAKKVLLPITSAADLGTVPPELVGSFNLIFYSSAEDAVFKALGVE